MVHTICVYAYGITIRVWYIATIWVYTRMVGSYGLLYHGYTYCTYHTSLVYILRIHCYRCYLLPWLTLVKLSKGKHLHSIYMHTVHVTFGLRNEYGLEMVEVMNTSQAESKLCMAIIDIK